MRKLIYILVVWCPLTVVAQMSSYWGESFNTKATLLSGAVVGGYEDESSIFYNPSILSDSGESKITFAAGLFKFDHSRFENAVGAGQDAVHFTTSVAPNFISVHLYPKDPFKLVWQAAIFSKTKYDGYIQKEVRMDYDVLKNSPGAEQYVGRYTVRNEYEDTWFGIGIAKFLDNKWSIGTSIFGQYKNLRYTNTSGSLAMPNLTQNPDGHVAQNLESMRIRAYNWRLVGKLGANWQVNKNLSLGMVFTLPSAYVLGDAEVVLSTGVLNIVDPNTGDFFADLSVDERGSNMKANFKDPFSIAMGVDLKRNDWRFNLAMEWFAKINSYRIIDERTGNVDTSGSGVRSLSGEDLSFVGGGNNIVNFAIGVEQQVTEKRSRIFGFKTNFDARKNFSYGELDGLNKLVDIQNNYYSFSGGTNFTFLNFNILFGLQYAFSNTLGLTQLANYTSPEEIIPSGPYILEGVPENTMNYRGNQVALFVSLTLK